MNSVFHQMNGSDATVDISESKNGHPVKAFIIQVTALSRVFLFSFSVVGGHTGSGDHRGPSPKAKRSFSRFHRACASRGPREPKIF
jgi:hypothetical protein